MPIKMSHEVALSILFKRERKSSGSELSSLLAAEGCLKNADATFGRPWGATSTASQSEI
eukprot:CAMPEP_0197643024 /NCGR_PEP_ID=MMETSP1338-20131121/16499_1 /TAXON_ID=43686 ORGANISM="Pelagodinium beii, Strain RCC1491" /NCGR_SAMPLE_ID=MMETSP1338 /ASSEMBLY_ACC=CAM_ASM_000754 /LENGTH=58 /DNA_ID=CAMNT_0043216233 /DNA_START=1 /DNA_END=175 /DNA_ORIENTATION=-